MATRLRLIGIPGTAYKPFLPRAPVTPSMVPSWRIFIIEHDHREHEISPENRLVAIDKDDRTIEIEPVNRTTGV